MYKISKRLEISASHILDLPYESKCNNLHGHNWIITVYCQGKTLNDSGMLIDFNVIKEKIHKRLDHKHLNDIFGEVNTTAENLARWVVEQVPGCYKAEVEETEGNYAVFVDEPKQKLTTMELETIMQGAVRGATNKVNPDFLRGEINNLLTTRFSELNNYIECIK